MNHSLLLSLLIYLPILAGLASLNPRLLVLAVPFVLYVALGVWEKPSSVQLNARRTLQPNRLFQGEPVLVTLTFTNTGSRLADLLVEDVIPDGLEIIEGDPRLLLSLESGETAQIVYTLVGQRGLHTLPGPRLTANDSLGVFRTQRQLNLPSPLFVLPVVHKVPAIAIRPRRVRVYPGQIPARTGGSGVEFFGVREYQPGDPQRWINHRAGARYEQTLFVNDFEQERAVDVGLILDVRESTNLLAGSGSLLEQTIDATVTLADAFLSLGNRVGLFLYGGAIDWTFPGSGKIQRERILRALARAKIERSQVFDKLSHLPTRLFPVRSQLVLISPLQPDDQDDIVSLRARGYELLLVTPDAITFEMKTLAATPNTQLAARLAHLERSHLLRTLGRAGVNVFEWDVETPFHQVAHRALGRSRLGRQGR
ncbi:MAG: DUF58 domain-containing protein [Caldilineaceae bacterium]|nr:DUF58 domain-containing protein [Caldilineaceae bacterium]